MYECVCLAVHTDIRALDFPTMTVRFPRVQLSWVSECVGVQIDMSMTRLTHAVVIVGSNHLGMRDGHLWFTFQPSPLAHLPHPRDIK